jgi:hypothetical protein
MYMDMQHRHTGQDDQSWTTCCGLLLSSMRAIRGKIGKIQLHEDGGSSDGVHRRMEVGRPSVAMEIACRQLIA